MAAAWAVAVAMVVLVACGRDGFDVDDVVAAAAAVTFLVVTVGVSVAVVALLLSLFVAARRFWVWLCIIRAVVVGGRVLGCAASVG